MQFGVSVQRNGSVARMELSGEMDLAAVEAFRAELDSLEDEGVDLLVDLSRLSFIDSSGLHELVRAHQRMAQFERKLEFLALPARLEKLFELTRVTYLVTSPADSKLLEKFDSQR